MTETTCPTCKSQVKMFNIGKKFFPYHIKYKPLPSLDLTKLREAHKQYKIARTQEVMGDLYDTGKYNRVMESIDKLTQAVKELLDENKP